MNQTTEATLRECRVVRAGAAYTGKQGLVYTPAISAEAVGSEAIHMQMLRIPPGGRARAHKHEGHETAIYAISGESCMWYGAQLEHHVCVQPGDYVYIPANVPHLPYNPSSTEACVAIIARTDPNEQESVVLLPELESLAAKPT